MITIKLTNEQRAIAIGQIHGGHTDNPVAQHFAVDPKTIARPLDQFAQTGHVKDRPHSGWPRGSINKIKALNPC